MLPSMPTLSSRRRQVASSRPPSSQAKVRRATGSWARQSQTLFFPIDEVPHLVDLHDGVRRRGRRLGCRLARGTDPLVDRDVAHAEELGDHSLADAAQGVEQHRQRLHRRRLAARRRRREAAAAALAAVALMAVRHAVPDERSAAAMLAGQFRHRSIPSTSPTNGDVELIYLKLSVSNADADSVISASMPATEKAYLNPRNALACSFSTPVIASEADRPTIA